MTIESQETSGSAAVFADLLADGWLEYRDSLRKYARCFYKRFDTNTRCQGNQDKPGVQVKISVSEYEHEGRLAMELELCAGLKDGTWLIIHNYALPQTVREVVALIPRMLAAWESANEKPAD